MANIRQIRRRIRSVQSTRQITKAMEMTAASKMKRAEERIEEAIPYAEKMLEVLRDVTARTEEVVHPLLEIHVPVKSVLILGLTSDRGLCGAFNSNILKRIEQTIYEELDKGLEVKLIVVGGKGFSSLRFRGYEVGHSYVGVTERPHFRNAQEISAQMRKMYEMREVDKVYLLYNRFFSLVDYRPSLIQVLPVEAEVTERKPGEERVQAEMLYEPSAAEVFRYLLPDYVDTIVYSALLSSAAAEITARRTAMKAASDNAEEMIFYLRKIYNRARQEQITKEIADIVGAAEALKKAAISIR